MTLEEIAVGLAVPRPWLAEGGIFHRRVLAYELPGTLVRTLVSWPDPRATEAGGGALFLDRHGGVWSLVVTEQGAMRTLTHELHIEGPLAPERALASVPADRRDERWIAASMELGVPVQEAAAWRVLGCAGWKPYGTRVSAPEGFDVRRVRRSLWRWRERPRQGRRGRAFGALVADDLSWVWYAHGDERAIEVTGPIDLRRAFAPGFVPDEHVEQNRRAFEAARRAVGGDDPLGGPG